MYKIYVKETQLILSKSEGIDVLKTKYPKALIGRYTGKTKDILVYIDLMEKSKKYSHVIIHSADYFTLKSNFKSLFKSVKAGGGLVLNEFGEALFIYKRGAWDLPKGKNDTGESNEDTAIREVMEETAIIDVKITNKICKTRHTFKTKSGLRAIKITHWYSMTTHKQQLIPQKEEEIEKAEWLLLDPFISGQIPLYHNLQKVLRKFNKKRQILSN